MKKIFVTLLVWVGLVSFTYAQDTRPTVVQWAALDSLLTTPSDTTYLVNFWATWCRPCVQELPYFEKIAEDYAGKNIKILLVSLDFVKDIDDRVLPFMERMQLKNPVWVLNEPDANAWIERVDKDWSGALPATWIVNQTHQKRLFFEKALTYEDLARELSYFIDY